MTKKIIIQKRILEELYIKKDLSTYQIAKMFNCNPSVIQKRLKEYKVKLRKPKKKIIIPREKLYNLYVNKKLSTQKIANILKISSCAVYYKLKGLGIETRHKNIIKINKKGLKKLYLNKNLSCLEIAKIFNCSKGAIFEKLKSYRINTKSLSQANIIYPKKRFGGNNEFKAYMIGFRLGDLNVKAKDENSTVMVKSNTTKQEQCELIKKIYGLYGHYKIKSRKDGVYYIWINLDKSFSFLIPRHDSIEDWIINNEKNFFSFLAGYIDAEGNISISDGSARLRIRTYDKKILLQIYNKLNDLGINAKFGLASKKGDYHGGKRNQDCWGVFIYSKKDLLKLLQILKPLIKHKKRYSDLILAEKNILERIKKWGG